MNSTMLKAQAHISQGPASVQHSEGDSMQGELRYLSVISIEDDMQLMDGKHLMKKKRILRWPAAL